MERWIFKALIVLTACSLTNENCTKGRSIFKGEQTTCANITASFFRNTPVLLGRSHWLACENCDINSIDEHTFNTSRRNNINYLVWSQNNLRVIRNLAFAKFPLLKVLSLRDNVIETLYEKCFHGIKRLTQLDLSNNLISVITDKLFGELENLDLLNLNHNEIYVIGQQGFFGLSNLKYLYLNHNNLDKLTENMFKYLISLKILYLENNRLHYLHPLAFVNLTKLNYLYMNNNSINHLEEYNFKQLTDLIDLQMRYNELEDIPTSSFNGLKNIKRLHLGRNRISKVSTYGFVGLESLERLELIGNKLDHFSFEYIKDMQRLSDLWLDNNQIINLNISYKAEVHISLQVLGLSDNRLNFLNYKLLYNKMPNLKELFISGNPWSCPFFVNMYNFFQNSTVLLCANSNCTAEDTEDLIDNACKDYYLNITEAVDFGDDFVRDSTALLRIDLYVFILGVNVAFLC